MAIRWNDRPGSRAIVGGTSATRTDLFVLAGTADQAAAYAIAVSLSAPFAEAAGQVLYRIHACYPADLRFACDLAGRGSGYVLA